MSPDCPDLHARLRDGDALDEALREHARTCPACGELLAGELGPALAGLEAEADPEVDASFAALESELDATPGVLERLRQASTGARLVMLLGAILALAGLILATWRRVDLAVYPLPRLLASAGMLVAACLACLDLVLRPLHRKPVPAPWAAILGGMALVCAALVAASPAAHGDHPDSLLGVGADFWPRAAACFGFGLVAALVLLAGVWAIERSGLRRRRPAALALLAAAAFANLLLLLHCPLVAPAHKLAGHASLFLPALLAVGLGAALRRRRAPLQV